MAEKIVKKQEIPVETIQKTHSVLYVITIILALIILTAAIGALPLIESFVPVSPIIFYIGIAVISLILGFITAVVIDKETESDKLFLLGGSIISFLSAIIILIPILIIEKIAALPPGAPAAGIETAGFFGLLASPIIIMVLMILCFNLTFLMVFFIQEEKSMKDLLVYLYSIIAFLILYFLMFFFVIGQLIGIII